VCRVCVCVCVCVCARLSLKAGRICYWREKYQHVVPVWYFVPNIDSEHVI